VTPGPWNTYDNICGLGICSGVPIERDGMTTVGEFIADLDEDNNENMKNDARFIAESRTAWPYWMDRAERAEGALRQALKDARYCPYKEGNVCPSHPADITADECADCGARYYLSQKEAGENG
jgi:hypothetical protein